MALLNWKHHALIQVLMSRGPLEREEFRKIFSTICRDNRGSAKQEFNDYLLKINKELSYVQMELRCCTNQNEGQICYGLVNNISDEQSKLGTRYSVPQIAFFKAIVEAIVQDSMAEGSIPVMDALYLKLENQVLSGSDHGGDHHVPPAIKNFTMSQKTASLHQLVADHWLFLHRDNIQLGTRSYLELRSLFHSLGVPSCQVCNEAGVKARVCETEDCTARVHHYCLEKKNTRARGSVQCSGCGVKWRSSATKEEANGEEEKVEASQNKSITARRMKLIGNAEEEVEHDPNGEDEKVEASQNKSTTARRKRMKRIRNAEEEVEDDQNGEDEKVEASQNKSITARKRVKRIGKAEEAAAQDDPQASQLERGTRRSTRSCSRAR